MRNVRSLLHRIKRLEQAALPPRPPLSPIVSMYGSFDAYEAERMSDIAVGKLDPDFEGVLAALRRWERDGHWRFR